MKLLNPLLKNENSVPVLFPFPPARIPVNETGKVTPESETARYAAIVWHVDDKTFDILEFDSVVYAALAAYRFRHKTLSDLEILLSRYETGEIRVMSGRKLKPAEELIEPVEFVKHKERTKKLLDRYLKFTDYQMQS